MKQKTFENPATRKFKWWFTLHGNESLLNELESKWPLVYSQTMWKLEPCFKPLPSVQQQFDRQSVLPGIVESHSVGSVIATNDSERQ